MAILPDPARERQVIPNLLFQPTCIAAAAEKMEGGPRPFSNDALSSLLLGRIFCSPAFAQLPVRSEERRWLPLAPVAPQGFVARVRAFRAPLQPGGLAVWGRGRGEDKPTARQPSSCAHTRGVDMNRQDPEIEELREKVHCAVVLEQTPPCWKLDRKESTKLSLKYRRGKGEILIVSHAGRGWWDPTSDAKGDVFRLVQRLEPGLSFGHVRKRLRAFAGLSPCFPSADRAGGRKEPDRAVAARWAERKAVWSNSPAWRYLKRQRGLSPAIIEAASVAGVLREGPVGSAWFAHFDGDGAVP